MDWRLAAGTLLAWATLGPLSINGWSGGARFQIAEWLSMTAPIDAIVIVVLAVAGAYLLLTPLLGLTAPRVPYGAVVPSVAVAIVGILNLLYVGDLGGAAVAGIKVGHL